MVIKEKTSLFYRNIFPVIFFMAPFFAQAQLKFVQEVDELPSHPRILVVKLIPQNAKNTAAKIPELQHWPK